MESPSRYPRLRHRAPGQRLLAAHTLTAHSWRGVKSQKTIDYLLQAPMWLLSIACAVVALILLLQRHWSGGTAGGIIALGLFLRLRQVRERDRASHREDLTEIRRLEGRPLQEVMAELRGWRAVEIPESIARPQHFTPLPVATHARYFEWREIVFRLVRDDAGACAVSIRNDEYPPATSDPEQTQ